MEDVKGKDEDEYKANIWQSASSLCFACGKHLKCLITNHYILQQSLSSRCTVFFDTLTVFQLFKKLPAYKKSDESLLHS
jgi:hypothetical protein